MHTPLPEEDIDSREFNQVHLIINSAVYHHRETLVCIMHYLSNIVFILHQLKTDILNKAIISIHPSACDSTNPSANEASSDNNLTLTNTNDIMLNDLLKSISNDTANDTNDDHDHDQEGDTAKSQCEIELYQLLLRNDFKMKMQDIESKVYNSPLFSWKSSAN
jgi:hypothetical protein